MIVLADDPCRLTFSFVFPVRPALLFLSFPCLTILSYSQLFASTIIMITIFGQDFYHHCRSKKKISKIRWSSCIVSADRLTSTLFVSWLRLFPAIRRSKSTGRRQDSTGSNGRRNCQRKSTSTSTFSTSTCSKERFYLRP